MSDPIQLFDPETFPSTGIVEFNEFETNLAEYKTRYEGVVYDLTDKEQEKRAKSDRLAIGKTIASLDRVHREVKSPLREKVDLLDGERKRIKDGLLEIQGHIKSQIAEHEAKIEAQEQALLARVEEIKNLAVFDVPGVDSALIESRIAHLNETVIDESFEHYEAEATFAKVKAGESLQASLDAAKLREEEAALLAKFKQDQADREQKEREERIAAEARAQAERESALKIERERQARLKAEADAEIAAEQAAQERRDAAIRAAHAQEEAVRAAEVHAAERAALAALDVERVAEEAARQAEEKARLERGAATAREAAARQAVEAERAADRLAQAVAQAEIEIADKRAADTEHRETIHAAAAAQLAIQCNLTQGLANKVVNIIATNKIPAVSIQY